jgi:hypothetical protein
LTGTVFVGAAVAVMLFMAVYALAATVRGTKQGRARGEDPEMDDFEARARAREAEDGERP